MKDVQEFDQPQTRFKKYSKERTQINDLALQLQEDDPEKVQMLRASFQRGKDSADTNPSSTTKVSITKEAMKEMLEHSLDWPIVVEAFRSDEFSQVP